MKSILTEIDIKAPATKVWEVLSAFENYPSWNPFVKSLTGDKQIGNSLEIFVEPPGVKGMTIKPKLLVYDANKELRWKGSLLMPGIFDGEHYFMIKDNGDGSSHFTHGEKFGGILIPLFGGMLKKTEIGFNQMNEALKKQCES